MRLTRSHVPSPLGERALVLHDGLPCLLALRGTEASAKSTLRRGFGACAPSERLRRERSRTRRSCARSRRNPFQRRVWDKIRAVPSGQTTSYGEIARSLGRPESARAVGTASALNPLWLLVPCHRALDFDGKLVGFAAGLGRKAWLLTHEARVSHTARSRGYAGS